MISTVTKSVLVPSTDSYFSDKDHAWFKQHLSHIMAAAKTHPWWRRNVLALEVSQEIRPVEILRTLADFGYEKVQTLGAPGDFTVRGDTISVYLSAGGATLTLELFGNRLERLAMGPAPQVLSEREQNRTLAKRFQTKFLQRLAPGDYVVHLDHGIGLYSQTITDHHKKYYEIQYAKGDRILVPPALAEEKLSPYIGFGRPMIHRLGGDLWFSTKRKVKEDVEKFARELLGAYARRALVNRPPLKAREDEFDQIFAAAFPYDETPDQADAIADVMADLAKPELMDRVICGDVGFGKTEVAMRAAAKVVFYGQQVAVLAPTTVLAQQHLETFSNRFGALGIKVAVASRAVSDPQIQQTLNKLAQGQIDILIGTHRLLSEDVKFKNLGLAVIDEEQRFGVKQKEKIKNLRGAVDVLSLTATPIPRTLHLALASVWNISSIMTPPLGRQPIKTTVAPYDKKSVYAAIKVELNRGGQVYYLFNSIDGIGAKARELQNKFSKARVVVAHARLNSSQLLNIISAFRAGAYDILVATTIIENGLDVPTVNTLIVEKAEKLGLAQAHQIRGRIGRSSTKAYAHFYYWPDHLTQDAQRRLEYLERFQELGDGLTLAMKDLEIRGAGDVLGRAQSGAVTAVGLNLYSSMLAEAVEQLRRAKPGTTG